MSLLDDGINPPGNFSKQVSLPYDISFAIFTRFPQPGKANTRLARDIGDEAAAHVLRYTINALLDILVNEVKEVNIVINYTCADSEDVMRSVIHPDIDDKAIIFIKQPELSLVERLDYIARCLGKLFILGGDVPGIPVEILNEAIARIQRNEGVMGITRDGGYYLLGIPYYRDVFTEVNYNANDVTQQTLTLMKKHYCNATILPRRLIDIDDIDDLRLSGLQHLVEHHSL